MDIKRLLSRSDFHDPGVLIQPTSLFHSFILIVIIRVSQFSFLIWILAKHFEIPLLLRYGM